MYNDLMFFINMSRSNDFDGIHVEVWFKTEIMRRNENTLVKQLPLVYDVPVTKRKLLLPRYFPTHISFFPVDLVTSFGARCMLIVVSVPLHCLFLFHFPDTILFIIVTVPVHCAHFLLLKRILEYDEHTLITTSAV